MSSKMKNDVNLLLEALRAEQATLEGEKEELAEQGRTLGRSRNSAARRCLQDLLPNLDEVTIDSLKAQVPGFEIPMTKGFLGMGKKLDPDVSLDTLRIQLGTHLDNAEGEVPQIWKDEVQSIDETLRNLQDKLVSANQERLREINLRIKAVEKLSGVDFRKMNPEVREKVKRAMAAQVMTVRQSTRPFANISRGGSSGSIAFPAVLDESSPDLLQMWFWFELLTPDSECRCEVDRIDDQGGGWGDEVPQGGHDGPSGGAFEEVPAGDQVDASATGQDACLETQPDVVLPGEEVAGDVTDHEALGSQAYS